jgi:4-amino-4-deoxy-L-arabinose transferase-like glycosyltransferase
MPMQRSFWTTSLLFLLLWMAAWLPRTVGLERFVTADERRWLTRSANFYQAIVHGDWPATFQREHPGVTIMWAGMAGLLTTFPEYAEQAPGQFVDEREALEEWLYSETPHTPLGLLAAGRWWIALSISLAIALSYFPLRRLLGESLAFFATLFIAWDPFVLALSRQLHPDGLIASLTTLAWLLWLAWLYTGHRWRDLIGSGVLMGLAWLTKTPAIFLVPAGGILLFLPQIWRAKRRSSPLTVADSLRAFVIWGAIATATFVLLWPAMWVDPLGTLRGIGLEMGEYVAEHVNPNFFWGEITADPGPWFYPVAWWLRTSPAVVLGVILVIWLAWRRQLPAQLLVRQSVLGLALFALIFALGMSVGSKKFDRYLLPAFPALAVIASIGWVGLGQRLFPLRQVAWLVGGAAAFLIHGLLGFLHYPYYLTYYNPLAGGIQQAERILMVGWGEGLDAAAEWLNAQPDVETARIVAWYGDGPFSYFLRSQQPVYSFWSPDYWLNVDYAVTYVNQWQRLIPSQGMTDYFDGLPAAHTVEVAGFPIARIYDLRDRTAPEFTGIFVESAGDLGDDFRLMGYTLEQRHYLSGDSLVLRTYLRRTGEAAETAQATLHLRDAADVSLVQHSQALTTPLSANGYLVVDYELTVPPTAAAGIYTLTLAIADAERPVVTVDVDAAQTTPLQADWGVVRLLRAEWPRQVTIGESFLLGLQAEGQVDGSLKVSTRVLDAEGALVAQADTLLTPELQVELLIPEGLPAGNYAIRVVVYDPETLAPFPDQAGNVETALPEVTITAR